MALDSQQGRPGRWRVVQAVTSWAIEEQAPLLLLLLAGALYTHRRWQEMS